MFGTSSRAAVRSVASGASPEALAKFARAAQDTMVLEDMKAADRQPAASTR